MNGMGNCGMESMPHFEWDCILQVGMCIGIGMGMCVVRSGNWNLEVWKRVYWKMGMSILALIVIVRIGM